MCVIWSDPAFIKGRVLSRGVSYSQKFVVWWRITLFLCKCNVWIYTAETVRECVIILHGKITISFLLTKWRFKRNHCESDITLAGNRSLRNWYVENILYSQKMSRIIFFKFSRTQQPIMQLRMHKTSRKLVSIKIRIFLELYIFLKTNIYILKIFISCKKKQ